MVWVRFEVDISSITLVVGALAFWILTSFKRRSNSPPGPWGIPVFGALPQLVVSASRVGMRRVFEDWYHRYGPIYSLKLGFANAVVLSDSKSIKDMLVHPEFQDRIKFDFTLGRPGDGVVSANGRIWQGQRKFIHQHFRELGVGKDSFEEQVATEADFLTDALLKYEGKTLDLVHLFSKAVSNVISSVTFGQRFDYSDESLEKVLQNMKEDFDSGMARHSLSVFFPFIRYIPFVNSRTLSQNLVTFCNFHNAMLEEHQANLAGDSIKDVMDAFLVEIRGSAGSDLADVFNDDNLFWTIGDLFVAGTESTTTTLLWVFLFLLNNPGIGIKLRTQLDSVVGPNRLARYSDRPDLPYFEAVISEALRLGTVSAISLPHVASNDVTFHGFHIPKGTIMLPNFHTLFTDSSKWDDTGRFWPERFLDDEGRYIKREDFIPFSTGRRSCIGEQLARMELFIFITHIVQKMEFSVPEGQGIPSLDGVEAFLYKPQPYEVFIRKCEC